MRAPSLPPHPTGLLQTLTARPHPIPKNKSAPTLIPKAVCIIARFAVLWGFFYNSAGAILTETLHRLHEASGQSEREMHHGSWGARRSWESRPALAEGRAHSSSLWSGAAAGAPQLRPCRGSSLAGASLPGRICRAGNGPVCPLGASWSWETLGARLTLYRCLLQKPSSARSAQYSPTIYRLRNHPFLYMLFTYCTHTHLY